MDEASPLRRRLAANKARLHREAVAARIVEIAPFVARLCERFSLHREDAAAQEAERAMGRCGPRLDQVPLYERVPIEADASFAPGEQRFAIQGFEAEPIEARINATAARHGIQGWCLVLSGGRDPVIGVDATDMPRLLAGLIMEWPGTYFSEDGCVVIPAARRLLRIHHEGTIQVWQTP